MHRCTSFGNGGNWPTFKIHIDNATASGQTMWILPGTDLSETWVVSQNACNTSTIFCRSQRWGDFNLTRSKSWENIAPYVMEANPIYFNLSDPLWADIPSFAPRGDYAAATLGLTDGSDSLTLPHQIVANF
ncbi:Similar to eukaryotic aspartyl protease [Glomerella graminicola M1.001]; acc. no. EFQ27702 [Pyronema omphalodes CBS 100304]|uniref:Similar to eukaryotic aspartyl protease [Glomerella graminicola M1.001] acc. no. EFQ27702 n=1 Tax=Pyronema omphalodes (strain CBS 100304) TaxID=1076935 RepID=U4LDN2_PYROM|nr:Similar to eukaryotic aspartyl protease [Glomerella graminicola M1.001]; acc. no. EFQ27702 [Pyronema omphalodes CBS 100304]